MKILYIRHLENGDIKTWQTKFENDFYNINFRKLAYMLDAASRKGRVSTKKKKKDFIGHI